MYVVEDEALNKNKTNENGFVDNEDDMELEERIDNVGRSRNKFDDNMFDKYDNEVEEVLEEDLITTGNVNHFDDYVFDDNKVTPDRPRARNSSQYMRCNIRIFRNIIVYVNLEIEGGTRRVKGPTRRVELS
uniref:Uncharacterized protein n=1 Tax=Lactuca sativa TaxID=4236 RepID=A0A9R1V5Z3_LACSA|nr:hypothetical protein LSAT_V11C600324780 [Lactuca sativa]